MAKNSKKITAQKLESIVDKEYSASSLYGSTVSDQRQENLDLYLMRDTAELAREEGRSGAKTSDVADVIDWMMPQLQEMLAAGDVPVEFVAISEKDVEQARQETRYCWHVINQQNEGFLISYTWHKDALISKNGIVKVYWQEAKTPEKETYQNLSEAEYQALLIDKDIEIKEVEEKQVLRAFVDPISGALLEIPDKAYSVTAERVVDYSQVKILNIAPENFFVRRGWHKPSLVDVPYCAHREKVSMSDLVAEGIDREFLESLPSEDVVADDEAQNRFDDVDNLPDTNLPAARSIWVIEHYVKTDINDDGLDECVKVRTAGSTNKLIDWEVVDSHPFISISPDIVPHRFYGKAVADAISEIQKIKTVLFRQMLDNIYLTNNPRPIYDPMTVDEDTVLNHATGAPIHKKQPNATMEWLQVPFVAGQSLNLFEYIDKMREERSGVSSQTQGLDPDSLKEHTLFAAAKLMSAAQQRILLIGRIFAEVGYKPLFLKVHEIVQKNEKNSRIFEVGGSYVETNPSSWRRRSGMKVKVGSGSTSKEQSLATLAKVLEYHEKIIAIQGGAHGIVTIENVYNALAEFLRLSGMQSVEQYFTPPEKMQPAPDPAPDPAIEVATLDIKTKQEQAFAKLQIDNKKLESENAIELQKMQNAAQAESNKQQLALAQIQADAEIKVIEMKMRAEIERDKIELESLRLQIELLRLDNQKEMAAEDRNTTALAQKVKELEEKLKSRKTYNFNYDKDGKITEALATND